LNNYVSRDILCRRDYQTFLEEYMLSFFPALSDSGRPSILTCLSNYDPERREQPRKVPLLRKRKIGNRVLVVGRQRELALYRAEFLRLAGYSVDTPEDIGEALRMIRNDEFDAIVLSYTLPTEAVQQLAESAREHCPDCPVIAIADTEKFDRLISPDAIALAKDGPEALLSALKRVLRPN
jgi:CheY-like chemotaxis protein